jgi:hypothetical protein
MRKRDTLRTKNRSKERKHMSSDSTASKNNLTPPASSATSAATGQREQQSTTIRYVDRADMAETFADSITGLVFDGQTLRIEFGVTRLDDVKANAPRTARRYPACRLVLSPATAVELINRMQQVGAALTQAGVVKVTPRAGDEAAKGG